MLCMLFVAVWCHAAMPWRWFNYRIGGTTAALFCVFQDNDQRWWMGTNGGFWLFNGYQSYPCMQDGKPFRAQVYAMAQVGDRLFAGSNNGFFELDPQRLSVRYIDGSPREIRTLAVYDDRVWLGSLEGLYVYDPVSGTIENRSEGLPHRAVYSLLPWQTDLYVGTYNGLCRMSGGIMRPVALENGVLTAANIFVNSMCRGNDGMLWLGLEGALLRYDPSTGRTEAVDACTGNSVKSLAASSGCMVAGTDNGIFAIYPDGSVRTERHNARVPYSLMSNVVWSLGTGAAGTVWAGTEMGLSIVNPDSPVLAYSISDLTGESEGMQVFGFLQQRDATLWIGGSNGIIKVDSTGHAEWFRAGNGTRSLSHNRVRDIRQTSDNRLWVATDGGINLYDDRRGRFVNHRIVDPESRLNANWVYGILEDMSDSTVWTAGYLGGIFVEKLERFKNEGTVHAPDTVISAGSGLPNNLIGQMLADRFNNKWVLLFRDSTLIRIDGRTRAVNRVPVAATVGSEPAMICVGRNGEIWCAAYNGVARINPDGNIDSRLVRFPFIGDAGVTAMSVVGNRLWVAANEAVYSVDTATMTSRLLPLPAQSYSAIMQSDIDGRVFLGAIDEIVIVDPLRLYATHIDQGIESFRFESEGTVPRLVPAGSDVEIDLPFDNHNVKIEFGVKAFSPDEFLRFCYILDDAGPELLPPNSNSVSFTSLPPGQHVIRAGIAGEPDSYRSLRIEVAMPWYASWPAVICYAVLAICIALVIVGTVRRRQQRRMLEMQRQSALHSVERRMAFLSDISHDLKTPLSMIIGPLSRARTEAVDPRAKADIETAYDNSLRLNSLIHQTMEINRLEDSTDALLIYSTVDVVEFCSDIIESYREAHPDRHFVFSAEEPKLDVGIDVVKLESLLNNLLSNAVKYTSDGDTIAASVRRSGDRFDITVVDDGVGIPESEHQLVFERLYRSPRTSDSAEGTGIGLYLVRCYAELLGGSVTLDSRSGQGASFRLNLPVGKPETYGTPLDVTGEADSRRRVLVVDDNRGIASFVCSLLAPEYACATAANGRAGLAVAATFLPDLIIVDHMMPQMSGLDMTRRLRQNPATASTPVLLLTAKDTPAVQAESVEAGVDAFIAKPFEPEVLLAKVRRMLEVYGNMNTRPDATGKAADTEADPQPQSPEQRKLAEITGVIESNIANPDLNVAFVCDTTGMAQKSLYRLLKKYTGISPVDYIRQTRMRKAAVLLEQGTFSVSEVMYMVGFSNSSYFSRCFSQQFGCTPGNYKSKK